MIKLLCVNARHVKIGDVTFTAKGLVEGETYITRGKAYKDLHNRSCYYIDGLGERFSFRFTEVHESPDEIQSEEAIEKLIKELNKD